MKRGARGPRGWQEEQEGGRKDSRWKEILKCDRRDGGKASRVGRGRCSVRRGEELAGGTKRWQMRRKVTDGVVR